MPVLIDKSVIIELYKFIISYYHDKILADSIISNFLDPDSMSEIEGIDPIVFFNILAYMQKISGDQLVCFNAGRHFAKNGLFRYYSISGIRFSLKRCYKSIHRVLGSLFPFISVLPDSIGSTSINLSIRQKDTHASEANLYFYEYIKGIISSLPEIWGLPFAHTAVASYPFDLEKALRDNDIIYQKKDDGYYFYDGIIAEEKPAENCEKEGGLKQIQVIARDIFLKDIFLKKHTVFKSDRAEISASWENVSTAVRTCGIVSGIGGLAVFIFLYLQNYFPQAVLLSSFAAYCLFLVLIKNSLKTRELKRIYRNVESDLLKTISEQRRTTSEAISNTQNRLKSIENIIEITKKIIYEKNIVTLFDTIRKYTAKALNADRATVFIHDTENRELRSGPELSEEAQEFRIPETKGIAGEIFKLRKIINIKDAYNNPNFDKAVDSKTGYNTKTILGAPLIDIGNNFIGIIQVLNKKGEAFEAIDEKILETLSTYIASALKDTLNIRNLEQRPIEPVIQKGINSVIQHIFNKNEMIKSSFGNNEKADENTVSELNGIADLLKKILFMFSDTYTPVLKPVTIASITDRMNTFVSRNINDKNISFSCVSGIAADNVINIDEYLLGQILDALLMNSIEAVAGQGEVKVSIYNYVKISNEIIHEFSINDLIDDYNRNAPHNALSFIDHLKGRKPLLDSDLDKIKAASSVYAAFDFFDTGAEIKKELYRRIFHPFFSTKNQFGLGLTAALNAAKRMSGILEEPVKQGNGKVFRALIPN
ncbi:MAG: GAF domain-containing protein [Spirochaetes bacterium]|nr:GAF domain-containing protein [Spirochaetota bacterium]